MSGLVSKVTLFDYSPAITDLSNEIVSLQSDITSINDNIALLQSAAGYDPLTAPALAILINQQSQLTDSIADLQATLTEITTISDLDSGIKDQLYYFYTVIGCSRSDFMVRMPFNYAEALVDQTIIALLSDTTNTTASKTAVAKLVFENYTISSAHARSITRLYRYLN